MFFFNRKDSYIQNMKEFRQYIEILIKITLTVLKEKSQCTQKSFTIVI